MKQYLKFAGLSAALAAAASIPASAEVPINEYLFVDGYAAATGAITDASGSNKDYSLFDSGSGNLDSVKFGIRGQYQDFGAYVSVLYVPDADDDAGILDAYVTWTKDAFTVTAGKFLSSLGYESFYPIAMTQISYSLVSGIPGYHTGAKVDYAAEKFSVGAAVVDSLQSDSNDFNQGDGSFSEVGFELYFTYTGIDKLTAFFGVGYDTGDESGPTVAESQVVLDFWLSYDVTEKLTLAAEAAYAENVADFSWLALAQYTFTDKISGIVRVSGVKTDDATGDPDAYKFTVSPTYKISENLSVRGEISYTNYSGGGDEYFYALQALFQF